MGTLFAGLLAFCGCPSLPSLQIGYWNRKMQYLAATMHTCDIAAPDPDHISTQQMWYVDLLEKRPGGGP